MTYICDPIDVVIPARNEAETLGPIIDAFHGTLNIGKVIVVDDQSTDMTWGVASEFGAMVIRGPGEGKGQAVKKGLELVTTSVVVLCDADLQGFDVNSADVLMVEHPGAMVVGVPEFSPNLPWAWKIKDTQKWGDVSGQRQIPVKIIRDLDLHGYAMEVQINAAAARAGLPVVYRNLSGVKGRVKANSYDQRIHEYLRDYQWLTEHGV